MEPNQQQPLFKIANPGFIPAIRPLIFAVIACIVVAVLFSSGGLISKHADLSFLVAPLVSYYILRLFSRLSSIYLSAYRSAYLGSVAACIFNGLAFSLFFFQFLGNAALLARIGAFSYLEGFLTDLSATAGYVVLFVFGRTVSKFADLSRELSWARPFYPPANALGQFFVGISLWQFVAAFSGSWSPLNKIGLVLFAGMLAVALTNIGNYGERSKNPFIADASLWLKHSLPFKFFIGAFIAAYILFIRPAIVGVFRYAPLVEWGIVCFLGWRLFSGIKSGIKIRCSVALQEADWQKHVQLISNLQGTDFPHLGEIQDVYIEDSSRDALLIYLTLLLKDNKVSLEEINRILHPLINYQDAKMPWFAFGWEQHRVLKQNEKNRRLNLGDIMANLKYIMNPANQKIEEQTDEENKPG